MYYRDGTQERRRACEYQLPLPSQIYLILLQLTLLSILRTVLGKALKTTDFYIRRRQGNPVCLHNVPLIEYGSKASELSPVEEVFASLRELE
jgi:hypothetical protein